MFVIGIIGIGLTANLTKPWGGLSAADWGWVAISWAGDVAIIYLVVEYIDERAWKKVGSKVLKLIHTELTGIATDIKNVSGANVPVISLPSNATEQEEQALFRKAELAQMYRFAADINSIRTTVQNQGILLTGGYGPLFAHRRRG